MLLTMEYLPEDYWNDADRRTFNMLGVRPVCWYRHPNVRYRVGDQVSVEEILQKEPPRLTGCQVLTELQKLTSDGQ